MSSEERPAEQPFAVRWVRLPERLPWARRACRKLALIRTRLLLFLNIFFEEILKRNGERQAKQYGLQREFKVGSAPSECKWIAT